MSDKKVDLLFEHISTLRELKNKTQVTLKTGDIQSNDMIEILENANRLRIISAKMIKEMYKHDERVIGFLQIVLQYTDTSKEEMVQLLEKPSYEIHNMSMKYLYGDMPIKECLHTIKVGDV